MRMMVAAAAACFLLVGLSNAQNATASIRKPVDIPPQSLASALAVLAKQRDIQIIYRSDVVGTLQSTGAVGEFTPDEALRKLLSGSGLTYHYLNDTTVTITPVSATSGSATPPGASGSAAHGSTAGEGNGQPGTFWNQVLLAQVDQGASSGAAKVEKQNQEPSRERAVQLEEVLVTAQKREERIQDVPAPVTVLNADKLAENGLVLLRDYYASVPGLSVTPNIETSQILSIRGISTGNFLSPTVGVLVDDALYTSALNITFQVPDIDPGDLARVEVLRGPQGTLYGANSMGGLIKYVTVDPSTGGFSGRIDAGTSDVHNGAEPGYNVHAAVNVPLGDTLAIRASGFTRQDPGYIDNPVVHIDGINEARVHGGRLATVWRPSEDFSLKLSALYQNTKGDGLSEVVKGSGLGDLQQNYIRGAGPFEGTLQAYSATLKAKLDGVDLTSVTAYNRYTYRDSWDGGVFFGPGALWADHFNAAKVMQEIRLSGSIWKNVDWLVGGFYTREESSHSFHVVSEDPATGQTVGELLDGTLPIKYEEFAGFADLTYHVTDRFSVQVGGREGHITVTNETETQSGSTLAAEKASANTFTYLLTPQYRVSPDIMAYARLASGYRPGGPNLAYAVNSVGAPAAFSPDKTYNYEVGVKGDFLDRLLSVDASLYYIDWKKIQLQLSIGTAGFNANGGDAKSQGVELSATLRPLPGLAISGWVAYDDAVLTDPLPANSTVHAISGDRLPNATRFSGNISVQQDFPLWTGARGFIGGQVTYVGDRQGLFVNAPPRQAYPAYTKTDLRAGVEYNTWSANLYANNVADRRAVINAVNFFPSSFIYIQPRTIGLSVSKRF